MQSNDVSQNLWECIANSWECMSDREKTVETKMLHLQRKDSMLPVWGTLVSRLRGRFLWILFMRHLFTFSDKGVLFLNIKFGIYDVFIYRVLFDEIAVFFRFLFFSALIFLLIFINFVWKNGNYFEIFLNKIFL